MKNLINFVNNIEGLSAKTLFLHVTKSVSPSFFIYIHSSFDTVLQQQKQRWMKIGVCQHSPSMPRMTGKSTNQEYQKAVAEGKLLGNESALGKVPVEGIALYLQQA